MIRYKTKLDLV